MKQKYLLLAAALGLTPMAAYAQMTPDQPPVTSGSAKTMEKVWKPGLRWIKQKPGELERIDGTTITLKHEGSEYVVYEDGERLQGVKSLDAAHSYAEKRVLHLVEMKVLPRTVVDQNAEEDVGVVKGVAPMGSDR